MSRHTSCFAILPLIAVLFLTGVPTARAGIEPGAGSGWLTIASRTDPQDAITLARKYAAQFPTAAVFGSSNGYYAVTLGWANIAQGQSLLASLISSGAVPADSYYTAGKRFIQVVWTAGNYQNLALAQFLQVTRIALNQQPAESQPLPSAPVTVGPTRSARVSGLDVTGDNYLSLRTGPGTANAEIARMRADTRVTVTGESKGWYQISLSNGMQGWAYGKYLSFEDVPVVGPEKEIPVVGPDPDRTTDPQPDNTQPETDIAVAPTPEPEKPAQKVEVDQKRVALVLGNSEYVHTAALPNPRNDADAISSRLEKLGFEVVRGLDGSKAEMERSVRDFVKILPGSDVALFFYAGHAMQVDGRNYMIPIDAKLEDSTAIDFETIDLSVVLNFMNTDDRISIALLDACRDNPLSRRFARSLGATRSAFIGRGLAAPNTGAGEMLIGFATAPGEVALDGDGKNSPFTTALLEHIDTQGLDIELMLKRVRQDVYEMTDRTQEPWVNSALRREFQFNPG